MTETEQNHDHDAECEEALHRELRALRTAKSFLEGELRETRNLQHIAETHQHRLEKELPLQRKENQRLMDFLKDASAYMRMELAREGTMHQVLATLTHDINGLANDEPCFLPRVHGYAQAEREQEEKEGSLL